MSKSEKLKLRPYARLLTMLGEQLIKNERIALSELVKNSYDADAPWVKISFENFGEEYEISDESRIIVEDDGHGMTGEVIEKHWLNPATPDKLIRKSEKPVSPGGRIIQGEKGIGRFAILKLGRSIKVITRARQGKEEYTVNFDFSKYDDDFLTESGVTKEIYLDDLSIALTTRAPEVIVKKTITLGKKKIARKPHGTRIEIADLKGTWSNNKIKAMTKDLFRLAPLFGRSDEIKENTKEDEFDADFNIYVYKDDTHIPLSEDHLDELLRLLEERSVFRIRDGRYDEESQEFRFLENDKPRVLKLFDQEILGLKIFKDRFGKEGERLKARTTGNTECGSFKFNFSIFDFSSQAPEKYKLDRQDKRIIKPHRIYLYRDDIRVYPYGDQEDDWLQIDMYRGTIAAGYFLSNDQVVGSVNITQTKNPQLKDKTSREGLIDQGDATADFIVLIQSFLAYIRQGPYYKYRLNLKDKTAVDIFRTGRVVKNIYKLKELAHDKPQIIKILKATELDYKKERDFLVQRAETTEELAGVGLSVETTSHDIMAIMSKSLIMVDGTIKDLLGKGEIDRDALQVELHSLRGMLSFVESQLKDIQVLFKSSKQRRKNIRVLDALEKIKRIYRRILKDDDVALTIEESKQPLIAKTTDAVLLQLFINLFDNAIYWLQGHEVKKKKITIRLSGEDGTLIFSDNGPGIRPGDEPYIFEAFFSGKGVEGRGLGLYIARQLLQRYDYAIDLADRKADRILEGATFVVNFIPEES